MEKINFHTYKVSVIFAYVPINTCLFVYAQAAVEEGIVVGGGCTLLRLASKVDAIRESLENDEQKVMETDCLFSSFIFPIYAYGYTSCLIPDMKTSLVNLYNLPFVSV